MDLLAYLNDELSNNNIEHHHFLISYNPQNKIIHCFFEGKTDESFYGTTIRNLLPDGYKLKTYTCGKKDNVLFHYNELGNRTSKKQPLLFFIDKDIDNIIPVEIVKSESIYETDYYSIENYIVTSSSLLQLWAEVFRQSSGTAVAEKLETLFEQAHNEYNKIALQFMAWVLHHRRKGGGRLNLDCIKTNELFTIDDNLKLTPSFTELSDLYNYLLQKTKVETQANEYENIQKCLHELSSFEIKKISRGHNEMDFFIEFCKALKKISTNVETVKITTQVDINCANAIDIMGPRIKPHQSLLSFLMTHFENTSISTGKTITV
ncbi:DUF4435 domain-containing protein [Aeromonas enteropelogenes]|uniref:DUF4435 domain-containing protein n=1 Tax=Aeromonas enteropelogenes TaxID=29489 RepID=UPI0009E3D700|nr:DUF4435 domain-containing protein [Aeromonas enteropelogenes]UBH51687.1 DUF4435 domain-containing protein [Aeromonas enteropelogenes]